MIQWSRIKSYADLLWYISNEPDANDRSATVSASSSWVPWSRRTRTSVAKAEKQAPQTQSPILSSGPPLFAVIIGINNYVHHSLKKLQGAVADAEAVQEYLENDLKVARDHITFLRNQQASCLAIIDSFRRLENDTRIKRNDPILIYYAGHGGETTREAETIQTIFPQDYNPDGNPQKVRPIPDRTNSRPAW
ncbi:hypothetical protein CC1G_06351 [Coprinopsis cinerea okayama7|uniref:Peptidase C14 caspase domain-containing protein n=1 Tax=Coprinopsis cinerea (strain Okayama-7 / 130 / ATCC MYA-4618 / FGSC 9003) TaxID=240176 RepID=A8NTM2_COPC7|nr:hypothetical protein CC1G_06351 [Coprinopsis cinerea okayama7\|eukprot:XP_001836266.2 hypothetical protein CC1G_06351 [Coprinopsis cinerea okayama7\